MSTAGRLRKACVQYFCPFSQSAGFLDLQSLSLEVLFGGSHSPYFEIRTNHHETYSGSDGVEQLIQVRSLLNLAHPLCLHLCLLRVFVQLLPLCSLPESCVFSGLGDYVRYLQAVFQSHGVTKLCPARSIYPSGLSLLGLPLGWPSFSQLTIRCCPSSMTLSRQPTFCLCLHFYRIFDTLYFC